MLKILIFIILDIHTVEENFSELYGLHFAKKYLKKFVIFRPHNVYGVDMGNDHVIPNLLRFKKSVKKIF